MLTSCTTLLVINVDMSEYSEAERNLLKRLLKIEIISKYIIINSYLTKEMFYFQYLRHSRLNLILLMCALNTSKCVSLCEIRVENAHLSINLNTSSTACTNSHF